MTLLKNAINDNQKLLDQIILPYKKLLLEKRYNIDTKNLDIFKFEIKKPNQISQNNISKARSTVRQFLREWSAYG